MYFSDLINRRCFHSLYNYLACSFCLAIKYKSKCTEYYLRCMPISSWNSDTSLEGKVSNSKDEIVNTLAVKKQFVQRI